VSKRRTSSSRQKPEAASLAIRERQCNHLRLRGCSLAVILLLCVLNSRAEAFRNVEVGDPAPPLLVEDLNGKKVNLAFTGKLTVLLFWKSEQAGSLAILEKLADLAGEFKGSKVEVVTIADGEAETPELLDLVKQQSFPFPVFIDRSKRSQERYGIIVFPSTGIIAENGRLQYYQPGQPGNYSETIGGKLKVLLGTMTEQQYSALLRLRGATSGEDRKKAQDHFAKGMRSWEDGNRREAISELTQAVALHPRYKKAQLQLGYLLLEVGDKEGALNEFQHVKGQNPHSPSADMGIGIVYLHLGESALGITLLEKAVNINPDPVRGHAELGKAYEAEGDLGKALFHYKRAISKLLQGRK
jgi:Flp pilus assembly protein TadD/peroxiredoxin